MIKNLKKRVLSVSFLILFLTTFSKQTLYLYDNSTNFVIDEGFKKAMVEEYNCILEWLNDSELLVYQGYLISDHEGGLHEYKFGLKEMEDVNYYNIPEDSKFRVVRPVFHWVALLSSDYQRLYLSSSKNFSQCITIRIGEEIPEINDWFFIGVREEKIVLRYAHIFYNCDAIESLVEMYILTKREKYHERARKIVLHLIDRIHSDDKVYTYFSGRGQEYRGMVQSYVMRALYRFSFIDPNCKLTRNALERLAKSYVITAEGTWNHWSNEILPKNWTVQ